MDRVVSVSPPLRHKRFVVVASDISRADLLSSLDVCTPFFVLSVGDLLLKHPKKMTSLTIQALSTSSGGNPDAYRKNLNNKKHVMAEYDSPQPMEPPDPLYNSAKSYYLLLSYHLRLSQRPPIVFAGQDNFHESRCTPVQMIYPPKMHHPPSFSSSSTHRYYAYTQTSTSPLNTLDLVLFQKNKLLTWSPPSSSTSVMFGRCFGSDVPPSGICPVNFPILDLGQYMVIGRTLRKSPQRSHIEASAWCSVYLVAILPIKEVMYSDHHNP